MKISDIIVSQFQIPFRKAITVAGQPLQTREGFILELVDNRGYRSAGEVAPLPGLDAISMDRCYTSLNRIKIELSGCRLNLDGFDLAKPLLGIVPASKALVPDHLEAPVLFGLESALLQICLQNRPGNLLPESAILEIPGNGLFVPDPDPEHIPSQIRSLHRSGFRTIKVKIGRLSPEIELAQIHQLISHFEEIPTLRLDGNRSLDLETYHYYYDKLSSLPVEYVEEPLVASEWKKALALPWPLALDETLEKFMDSPVPRLDTIPGQIRHIIIKPNTAAGISGLYRLLSAAAESGIQAILSSAFNTGLGISVLGLLATLFITDSPLSHGLDTLKYLEGDLPVASPVISNGNLQIPINLLKPDAPLNTSFIKKGATC